MRAEAVTAKPAAGAAGPAWLAALLEIQRIIDTAVAAGIARAEKAGRRLACARGCAACCRTHADVPVYPLELMGIYWFAMERLGEPLRERLKAQLARWRELDACPFLVDDVCAIHPVRPMACRLFNVLDTTCAVGEDALHTRPQDVLPPPQAARRKALMRLLAQAGVADPEERKAAVDSGAVHRLARNLRTLPWEGLARRMEQSGGRQAVPANEKGESNDEP